MKHEYYYKRTRAPKVTEYSGYRIAKELGISEMSVSRWRRGICLPDDENMAKLMKLLDKSKDDTLIWLARGFSTYR